MNKLIALITTILIALALLVVPADSHSNYDGSPFGEGTFTWFRYPTGSGSIKMRADDTQTDGHCVYMKANYAGSNTWVYTSWSCGAPTESSTIYTPRGNWRLYVCVTGHNDCDLWRTVFVY